MYVCLYVCSTYLGCIYLGFERLIYLQSLDLCGKMIGKQKVRSRDKKTTHGEFLWKKMILDGCDAHAPRSHAHAQLSDRVLMEENGSEYL